MRRTTKGSISTRSIGAFFRAERPSNERRLSALLAVALVATLTGSPTAVAQPPASQEGTNPPAPPPPVPTEADRAPEEASEPAQGNAQPGKPTFTGTDGKDPGPHKVVEGLEEAKGLRTASMKVFKVPGGGAHIAQIFTGPVHFQDQQGNWREIDTSVAPVDGGFRNAANDFDVFMPSHLGGGMAVRTTVDGGSLSVSLAGAEKSKADPGPHHVVYRNVFNGVDVEYRMLGEGYKENVILDNDKAPSAFRYRIDTEDLSLALAEDGSITVSNPAGEPVGSMPPLFAQEAPGANGLPGERLDDLATTLTEVGPGRYELEVALDEEWLSAGARRFPVTLDPSFIDSICPCPIDKQAPLLRDMTLGPGQYDRDDFGQSLYVGKPLTGGYSAYLTFDVRQEIRKVGNLIYKANFDLLNFHSAVNGSPTRFELRRITQDWRDNSWEAVPQVDPKVWATYDPCAGGTCQPNGYTSTWWRWDVKDLMQYWIDTGIPSNHGWQISPVSGTGVNDVRAFRSKEFGSQQPYLYVAVNAMPSTRPFVPDDPNWPYLDLADDALQDGMTVSQPPTLKIKDLTDTNNDQILVRYQVSKSPTDFSKSQLAYTSGWIAETQQHLIPPDELRSGTYYWRVQASDVCGGAYRDPDQLPGEADLCDDLSNNTSRPKAGKNERPTSVVRAFHLERVNFDHRGTDPRWARWKHGLGNGMVVSVNQSNGNLVLEYPIDSLVTSADPLEIGLSFNSDAAADGDTAPGLTKGWELSAGPGGKPGQVPVRLEPDGKYVTAVVYASGKRESYVSTDGKTYKTIGPFAGTLRKTLDNTWVLTTYTGGTYAFNSSYDLVRARPSTSTAAKPGFDYVLSGRKVVAVKDPDGRTTSFEYAHSAGYLSKIMTWTGGTWKLTYDSSNRVIAIEAPDGKKVEFDYDSRGKMIAIRDGEEAPKDPGLSTQITYLERDMRFFVSQVKLPGAEHPWGFEYHWANTGRAKVSGTTVTDPRGMKSGGEPFDFEVRTDFGVNGLPVQSSGPFIDGVGWPVHRWRWDENENLVCSRDAAANLVSDMPCDPVAAGSGGAAYQTEYKYQKREPYLLTEVLHPHPGTSHDVRAKTTYEYDGGLTGLQAQYFENPNLSGLPKAMETTPKLDFYWGYSPPGTSYPDEWSARYFGEYIASHASGWKTYRFRADIGYSGSPLKGEASNHDRVRVAVGETVVLDCWTATPVCTHSGSVDLMPGRHPIVVEFADVSDDATLRLSHETSPGTFQVVPASSFAPNVDVLTRQFTDVVSSQPRWTSETIFAYPAGKEYLRLPNSKKVSGTDMPARTTTYVYDEYGRLKEEAQSATGGTVTKHDYVLGCPTKTTRGTATEGMVVTDRTCTTAGDVKTETLRVGDRLDNATGATLVVQDRTTTTTYDGVGRITGTESPDGGFEQLEYDGAGRLKTRTVKASKDASAGRVTAYEYEPEGWLTKKTLPRPEPGDSLPVVDYEHDEVGSRTSVVDVRGETWAYEYNPLNLRTKKTSPTGAVSSWTYDLAGRVDLTRRPAVVAGTGPSAVVDKDYDVLGRLVSTRLGGLVATTYKHDPAGNVVETKDPDGVLKTTKYNAAGDLVMETVPIVTASGSIGTQARHFTYDARGLLQSEKNFRGHATTYTYDGLGRLKTVMLPHGGPNTTTYWYNDAGEVERVRLPKTGTDTIGYDYDYSKMGYLVEERDGVGHVTTHVYNAFGEKTSTADPRDIDFTYTYDDSSRLQTEVADDGSVVRTETYDYDLAGNMKLAQNEARSVRMTYDDAGRLDTVVSGISASDVDLTINYDYLGNRVSKRVDDWGAPGGADVDETTFTYDNATGRLAFVKTPLSPTTTGFAYKPSGRLAGRTDPNGLEYTFGYDVAGRLDLERVTKGTSEVAVFTQKYDVDSHVVERTNFVTGSNDNGTWTFEYDEAGRLKKATEPPGANAPSPWTTYEYDGAGNRTKTVRQHTQDQATVTTTSTTSYDAASRADAMTVSRQEGTATPTTTDTDYASDEAGNLTLIDDGTDRWTYTYDPWNRMLSSKKGLSGLPLEIPIASTYQYDAFDRTVAKGTTFTSPAGEVTVETERTYYEGLGEQLLRTGLVVETPVLTASSGTTYAYGGGQTIGMQRKTETTILETNELTVESKTRFIGSTLHDDVSFMTDELGELVATKTYDPWGVVRTHQGEEVDLGFQGDPTDEETGLVDMGARYYLPGLGRFTTEDAYRGHLSLPLSQNRYAYGEADPVSVTDPTGTRVDCDGACPDHDAFKLESDTRSHNAPDVEHSPVAPAAPPVPTVIPGPGPDATPDPNYEGPPTIFDVLDFLFWQDIYTCGTRLWRHEFRGAAGSCVMSLPVGKVGKLGKLAKYGDDVASAASSSLKARALAKGTEVIDDLAAFCRANSFTGKTRVVMKDGSRKRIDRVEVGDYVLAKDPVTGARGHRMVLDVIKGRGPKLLVDLSLGGSSITATQGHPFWSVSETAWVDAGDLRRSDRVADPQGNAVVVGGVRRYSGRARVFNLTVAGLHTYFVGAGRNSVLVHNCGSLEDVVATEHGLLRLAQFDFDPVDLRLMRAASTVYEQADGAKAYVAQLGPDSFNMIVIGEGGVVTAHKGMSRNDLDGLARNYDWTGYP